MSFEILASAVSDVGYWRWWAAELPDRFQLEFGGTQLWTPPLEEGAPPCGQIALRFLDPTVVAFLTWPESGLDDDWPAQLHADRLEPFGVSHDDFRFDDADQVKELLASGTLPKLLHGELAQVTAAPHWLAFRAGAVGCIAAAREIKLVGHNGEIALDEVRNLSTRWWEYWRDYWRLRDTPQALPKDYACEVTIPLKQ